MDMNLWIWRAEYIKIIFLLLMHVCVKPRFSLPTLGKTVYLKRLNAEIDINICIFSIQPTFKNAKQCYSSRYFICFGFQNIFYLKFPVYIAFNKCIIVNSK